MYKFGRYLYKDRSLYLYKGHEDRRGKSIAFLHMSDTFLNIYNSDFFIT